MKVLDIELSDWEEFGAIISRDSPLNYVDIRKSNNVVNFGGRIRQFRKLFEELYSREYLATLTIEQVKELVDQFLVRINDLEAFI